MFTAILHIFIFSVGFKIWLHTYLSKVVLGLQFMCFYHIYWFTDVCIYVVRIHILESDSRFDFIHFSRMSVFRFWSLLFYQVHQCTDVCIYIAYLYLESDSRFNFIRLANGHFFYFDVSVVLSSSSMHWCLHLFCMFFLEVEFKIWFHTFLANGCFGILICLFISELMLTSIFCIHI